MLTSEFDFEYPQELIATEPARPSRVAVIERGLPARESNLPGLLGLFQAGDLLVINETRVNPARVFATSEHEILFLKELEPCLWEVLFSARDFEASDQLELPGGLTATLAQKGLPQRVRLSRPIGADYFTQFGEVALPPYIQQARGLRRNRAEDLDWYQTRWAERPGSVAAPTASLHFTAQDLATLKERGVDIARVTLHVGAGTFLPVKSAHLEDHQMHPEFAEISAGTVAQIATARARKARVWALGTTVARTLESRAAGQLSFDSATDRFRGETRLFIYPPYRFLAVDALLTNFHQPKSTLFSLVCAFAGVEVAKRAYGWAIERRFRLFSYGDLSAWM